MPKSKPDQRGLIERKHMTDLAEEGREKKRKTTEWTQAAHLYAFPGCRQCSGPGVGDGVYGVRMPPKQDLIVDLWDWIHIVDS